MCSHQRLSLITWEGRSRCYCLSTSGSLCVIASVAIESPRAEKQVLLRWEGM